MQITNPILKWLHKQTINLHTRIYCMSDGKMGGKVNDQNVILLTTSGLKSRLPRTVPIVCVRDGDDYRRNREQNVSVLPIIETQYRPKTDRHFPILRLSPK